MNTIWSSYIQGTETLYFTRKLRFDDAFKEKYKPLFGLNENTPLKILEIGCGPGALAAALKRWYPNANITAIDRDSEFIRFAKEHEKGICFMEGDATALPFDDNTFDVTISNTVSEHIEPSKFFGEQFRVLKTNGICLVLSGRKSINITPKCLTFSELEQQFWKRVDKFDDSPKKYEVCKYPMTEAELPLTMKEYGFSDISTGYVAIDLTPDDPKYSSQMAHDMINANRQVNLNPLDSVLRTAPEQFTVDEIRHIKALVNAKYDKRIEQYENGEKQWDTNVSITMVARGTK